MASLFIPDGFNLDGKIAAKGKLPALSFRYRPAFSEEIHEYRYAIGNARSGKERAAAEVKLLTDHLVSWDAVGAGEAGIASINADTLRRLPDGYRSEMVDTILWGYERQAEAEKN